jgi:hypothetical protein
MCSTVQFSNFTDNKRLDDGELARTILLRAGILV